MDGNIEKVQSLTGKIKTLAIDTTLTKKGMCAEAEATGEALATKVNISDIVDELTSVADDKPLSANQGRVLKKQIDEIDPHTAENVVYDNADSGVDAENVQGAIDKLSKAENIAYDEEKSVQGAIDELNEFVGITKNNYIPYPYSNVKTENGIVFTDLGNGRIKANGKTSGISSFYLQNNFKPSCSGKKVILSIKSTSGQASVFFRLWGAGGTYIEKYDFNIIERNGEITIDMPNATEYSYASVELFYNNTMNVTDDIVEIMIRNADIEDDTYKPYVTDLKSLSVKTYITEQKSFEITAGNVAEGLFDLPSEIGINEVLGVTILTDGSTYILSNIRSVNKNRIHINFRNVWTSTIGMYAKLLIMYR